MVTNAGASFNEPFRRLWQLVKRQIADDVPEDLAICEFDCRKVQCTQAEWIACERRIRMGHRPGSAADQRARAQSAELGLSGLKSRYLGHGFHENSLQQTG